MKKLIIYISIPFVLFSCLKKIDEVDHLTTNIFDPDYNGEQWWTFDKVVLFTDSNNDLRIKMYFTTPEENMPLLSASGFSTYVLINNEPDTIFSSMSLQTTGDYKGTVSILYPGVSEYCVEQGMYNYGDNVAYNGFTACKSL